MAERNYRVVRMGIDADDTYIRCVAIDNETHETIGKNQVKTTRNDKSGVAAGAAKSFQNRMHESNIAPEDAMFVARSTTQATSASIEGGVASVGVVGVAGSGLEGSLAEHQLTLKDVILDEKAGRVIKVYSTFIKKKVLTKDVIDQNIDELLNQGSQVTVASMAFSVDSMDEEMMIHGYAEKKNASATMAFDITKLYGLTRHTCTAAINVSILPRVAMTANAAESSVRVAGVTVPLMIMRGDDGVMEISEMRKHPILTALSGPAASIIGSLMYLRASNAIYFEVGGATTNIGVIKNGRSGADYAQIGGYDIYISSLDVRTLGCAGDSMVYISGKIVMDIGPHSAYTAGCKYTCFTPEEEIEDPQIEMISPKPGDPNDYVTIRLKNGKCICLTNMCAANVLGLIEEQYFTHGNADTARKTMQPVAGKLGITVEKLATQTLDKDFEKVSACISALIERYQLGHENMKLVGCGGGAVSLAPYYAGKVGLQCSIPKNAGVISSIGVVLPMVRDVVEHVVLNPSQDDIRELKKEAADTAISSDASPDMIEVHIKIDNQTNKVTAVVIGSTKAKTTDPLKGYDEAEACGLVTQDLGLKVSQITLAEMTGRFYVYRGLRDDRHPLCIVDEKRFIKVQCSNGNVAKCKVTDHKEVAEQMWKDEAAFKTDTVIGPDFFVCVGPRVGDYNAVDLDRIYLSMDLNLGGRGSDKGILITASVTEV